MTLQVTRLPLRDWVFFYKAPGPCLVNGTFHSAYHLTTSRGDIVDEPPRTMACGCGHVLTSYSNAVSQPRHQRVDNGLEIRGQLPIHAEVVG